MNPRTGIRILIVLAALLPAVPAAAFDAAAATEAFRAGNDAYVAGDFAAAEKAYARAIEAGAQDARLFYNRGNALVRMGRIGEAIRMYERARLLAPGDEDLRHNLEFARARTVDKLPEPPEDPVTRAFARVQAAYAPATGTWVAFALYATGFLLLSAALFVRGILRTGLRITAAAAFLALLVFAPALAWKIRTLESPNRAVVLERVTDVHSGPGEEYETLFRVHEGTAFDVRSRQDGWLEIRLPDGRGGFVRAESAGEI